MRLPSVVLAADWSVDGSKRWAARAELRHSGEYLIFPPEPVGELHTFIERVRTALEPGQTGLVGFDFPIGLPALYAEKTGITSFRSTLREFGNGDWATFFDRTNQPSLRQPFFPLATQKSGNYHAQLAAALGCSHLSSMLRTCDRKSPTRKAAECIFYTLGSAQVGAGAIVGWRDVIQPGASEINLWPFDGDLPQLLEAPGVTVAEIYPAEAYAHLGVRIGAGTGRAKTQRANRQAALAHLTELSLNHVCLSSAARSWFRWGFQAADDFDAMMGLLSMIQVVTGQRTHAVPPNSSVREIEGWILGQMDADATASGGTTQDGDANAAD